MSKRLFSEHLLYNMVLRRPIKTISYELSTTVPTEINLSVGSLYRIKPKVDCLMKCYKEYPIDDDTGEPISANETERIFADEDYTISILSEEEIGYIYITEFSLEEPIEVEGT